VTEIIGRTPTNKIIIIAVKMLVIPLKHAQGAKRLVLSLFKSVKSGKIARMHPVDLVNVDAIKNTEQISGYSIKYAPIIYKNVKVVSEYREME
jgi:hypothetical protein